MNSFTNFCLKKFPPHLSAVQKVKDKTELVAGLKAVVQGDQERMIDVRQ